ncbi:Ig-like domain-containing protein [Serratia fonticola]|uniref:Ig-like domain-containing protein n=1 Tax=Serratia fonticola TaxID=47917 RepID=UPI0027ED519E|nr:Ig-like domain-containing protein [Serratia fonticola]MDQ7209009.1 Ig-like domain-containing protein [Serratia fonticola]HBE9089575.1 Ig domain-containing protein [Serratia fonticola]
MEGCNDSGLLVGKNVVLEVALGCADTMPAEEDWKALAAGTSKSADLSPNTVTSDADDGGAWVANATTNADATISFEGEVRTKDSLDQFGFGRYFKYFVDEMNALRQPTIWVRIIIGPIEFTGYMVITALSTDGGTNDIVTFSTEFKVADSKSVVVALTDNVAVTGVTLSPTTSTGAAGGTSTFTVTVLPANATNKAFNIASTDVTKATATAAGNVVTVNRVATGSGQIIVSTVDGNKVAAHSVTVT